MNSLRESNSAQSSSEIFGCCLSYSFHQNDKSKKVRMSLLKSNHQQDNRHGDPFLSCAQRHLEHNLVELFPSFQLSRYASVLQDHLQMKIADGTCSRHHGVPHLYPSVHLVDFTVFKNITCAYIQALRDILVQSKSVQKFSDQ